MKPTTDTSTLKKNPAHLEFPADILNYSNITKKIKAGWTVEQILKKSKHR